MKIRKKSWKGRKGQTALSKTGIKNPVFIGIAGSSQGVGTTHFSIMTAAYLSGVLGKHTVLLERNDSKDFGRIQEVLKGRMVLKEKGSSFNILEISFIKEASTEAFSKLANSDADVVVVDFGNDFETVKTEFLLCQRKFLVGSLAEWKLPQFLSLAEGKRPSEGIWEYFTASGSRELEMGLKHYPGIMVRRIPRTEDAFSVTGEVMDFFGKFLEY